MSGIGEILLGATLAVIGGIIAARFNFSHERKERQKYLAKALLTEIEMLQSEDRESNEDWVEPLLDTMEEHGMVPNKDKLIRIFAIDPSERFPVYYSSLSELAILPIETARPLMRYQARRSGIIQSGRLLFELDWNADQLKQSATRLKQYYSEMMAEKELAVSALRSLSGEKANHEGAKE